MSPSAECTANKSGRGNGSTGGATADRGGSSGFDVSATSVGAWLRMHLVANAALIVLPAGRAVCEGVKFVSLSAATGAARSAAVVVVQHSMTLLALGAMSIPCTLAALVLHAKGMALAIAIHGLAAMAGAFALVFAARRAAVPPFADKWLVPSAVGTFRETVLRLPWFSPWGFAGKLINRVLQATQYAICLLAVAGSTSLARTFIADGMNLVGSTLGEFIPAQVGTVDGALAYAAPQLQITMAMAVGIATLARITQLTWSAVGALVPLFTPAVDTHHRASSPSLPSM